MQKKLKFNETIASEHYCFKVDRTYFVARFVAEKFIKDGIAVEVDAETGKEITIAKIEAPTIQKAVRKTPKKKSINAK